VSDGAGTEVTVAEMLRRIAARRGELDTVFENASPPAGDAWSVKDHMAHIACWEHSAVALLNGEDRYAHAGVRKGEHATLDTDGINQRIHAMYRDASPGDVRRYYDQVHADLVARIRSMSDEDLQRPYSHYQPGDPPYNAQPVIGWIVGNTFEHYAEHANILRPG